MAGGVKHGREAGFTLIEIILVLILMGLLTAVGVSKMSYLQAPDAATEYQKALMMARIAHARNQALLRDEETQLQITGSNLQYSNNMTPLANESQVQSLDKITVTNDRSDSSFTLTFNPKDFTCNEGQGAVITLTPTDASSAPVTISISGVGYAQ